jgi:predicted lactoylglutathione lyase
MSRLILIPKKIFRFYYEGFKGLSSWGKQVWVIIIIKLFIILVILKLFFFKDFLKKTYHTDADRSNYVLNQLTNSK